MRAMQRVRSSSPTTLAIDVGSSCLRVAQTGGSVREHHFSSGPPYAVARGSVADAQTFQRQLRSLVRRHRGGRIQVSVPAGSAPEAHGPTLRAIEVALGASAVVGVPSSLAALRGVDRTGPALVVDLGAQLIEVSWIDPEGFVDGAAVPWGAADLEATLAHAVGERHRIRLAPFRLGSFWAGSTLTGRCVYSGSVKVVRIDRQDIARAIHTHMDDVANLIQQIVDTHSPQERSHDDLLLVGGGAAVRDLRNYLEAQTRMRITVPTSPARAVVAGLLAA